MSHIATEELAALEAARNSRILLYIADDRSLPKSIEDEDVPVLYECLRAIGPTDRLDLVLHTNGGRVNVGRKISLLLRTFGQQVNVLVPYKARSAGTLMCLGANQIVMSAVAELGPLDPQVMSAGEAKAGPQAISTESIHAFRRMAEEWFDLRDAEHRMQLFSLLSERIFPTSLGTFFRSDKQMRQIANELLQYQLPDVDIAARQQIVDHLVGGYYAHDYCITRTEARQIGLRISAASEQEEALLWAVLQKCYDLFDATARTETATLLETVDGIIASTGFTARHIIPMIRGPLPGAGQGPAVEGKVGAAFSVLVPRWQII
jgi:ATP-dependent protease ClpP protease subunit